MNTTIINEAIADAIIRSISDYEGNFSLDVDIDANTFAQVSGHYGNFSLDVDIDANTFAQVSGHYEIQGYCEDDYFNGTGAWVTTYANVVLEDCDVFTYDEDGEEIENNIEPDLAVIERYVEKELE